MPVYLVKSPIGDRLVDAPAKATAINHVARRLVFAEAVTTSELVKLMQSGMPVEVVETAAKEDPVPEAVSPVDAAV